MQIVGLIIAGDGEVEECMGFASRDEAEEMTDRVWRKYFDPSYDVKVIAAVRTYDETVAGLEQAKRDDEEL